MKKSKMYFASIIFVLGLLVTPFQSYASEEDEELTSHEIQKPVEKPWYEVAWDWIWE